MKVPSVTAVRRTPRVERTIPCPNTGLTDFQLVSRPPENKIKLSAIIPMNCAVLGLSNRIPPIPSEPDNIPTPKKSSNVGTPNL